jgi:hypothetical protein
MSTAYQSQQIIAEGRRVPGGVLSISGFNYLSVNGGLLRNITIKIVVVAIDYNA